MQAVHVDYSSIAPAVTTPAAAAEKWPVTLWSANKTSNKNCESAFSCNYNSFTMICVCSGCISPAKGT